jgi:gamma-polyglutamate biosynthesis protein CapA
MKRKMVTTIIVVFIIFLIMQSVQGNRVVKISIVGDVLLDRGVRAMIEKHSPSYPYENISTIFKKSDITVGNLECPITDNGAPILKKGNLIFRGAPSNVPFLYDAGFKIFNLANNHAMDYGSEGISSTIKLLNDKSINTFGGGLNQRDAEKPLYVHTNGVTVGFLGFSAFPPEGYIYFKNKPDVAHLDEDRLHSTIMQAKRGCDILIVMFHFGKEFDFYPSIHQRTVAHIACDSGADIVIGQHPHVLQGIEKYKGKYIFYSLGNFVFDRQIPPGTDQTGILQFSISKKQIRDVSLLPIKITNCQPEPCDRTDAQYIAKRLILYSKGMGAAIEFKAGVAAIH